MIPLDRIDHKIIEILRREARITYSDLAPRVGLSQTPCKERVKKLEKHGVIQGYQARIDASAIGMDLLVFVEIKLSRTSQDTFKRFRAAVMALAAVEDCYLVSGNFDYLVKARVADMSAYREFLGKTLLSLPNVRDTTSYVVMETVKEDFVGT